MIAVAGPLLVLQSLPGFLAERSMGSALSWVSLLLAGIPCVLVPIALLRPGVPDRSWLLPSVACFLLLVAFERFEIRVPSPTAYEPWLAGIACITAGYIAIGVERPAFAAVTSVAIITEMAAAYCGAVPARELAVDVLGALVLSAGLIVGATVLRRRADRGDEAQQAAQEQFERTRRHFALEDERVRTDALLHDSVLTTLLVSAAGRDRPDRNVQMARRALAVVSETSRPQTERSASESFGRAVLAAEQEFAPLRGLVRLDLSAARAVQLPLVAADGLIAATLQAISNSIKHAGPGASCVAHAEPIEDGGLRVSIRDDGCGFDFSRIAPERLGVRISIIDRMNLIGGHAEVLTAPGSGTTVILEWFPQQEGVLADDRQAALR